MSVEGKAYLVPTEGDAADVKTLVPIDEVFAALAGSKAQEKLLILDVCRIGESGDRQRPGGEPMSAELLAALTKPPAGFSVAFMQLSCRNDNFGLFRSFCDVSLAFFIRSISEAAPPNDQVVCRREGG